MDLTSIKDENTENNTVIGLDLANDLNESLPFLKHSRDFFTVKLITVEGSETRTALDIFDLDLDPFGDILSRAGDISIRHFGHTVLQEVRNDLSTSGFFATGPPNRLRLAESGGGDDGEPLLLGEWMFLTLLDDLALL